MRRPTIRTMVIALFASALMGCQSGPRWASSLAWWKHDAPPEDTSLVARSAAPELPSAQSTPPQISPAAVPPSAANLAAATTPAASVPAAPLPSTVASAPAASYPAVASSTTPPAVPPTYPTTSTAAATYPTSLSASSTSTMPATASASSPTLTAQTGPYDPNAYRPPTALSTPAAATTASDDDRYANSYADVQPDRYATTPSAAGASAPAGDRLAAVPDRYDYQAASSSQPVAPTPTTPPTTSSLAYEDDRYGMAAAPVAPPPASPQTPQQPAIATATPASMPTAQYPAPSAATAVASTVSATVQLTTPPGQYRPGGTSDYPVQSREGEVEVASRPAATGLPVPSTPTVTPGTAIYPSTYPTTSPAAGLGTY